MTGSHRRGRARCETLMRWMRCPQRDTVGSPVWGWGRRLERLGRRRRCRLGQERRAGRGLLVRASSVQPHSTADEASADTRSVSQWPESPPEPTTLTCSPRCHPAPQPKPGVETPGPWLRPAVVGAPGLPPSQAAPTATLLLWLSFLGDPGAPVHLSPAGWGGAWSRVHRHS